MFEADKYIRELKSKKRDVEFLNAVIDGLEKKLKETDTMLESAVYQRDRACKRLDAALSVLRSGMDICELCANRYAPEDCDILCDECCNKCPCGTCTDGSGFEWEGDKNESEHNGRIL